MAPGNAWYCRECRTHVDTGTPGDLCPEDGAVLVVTQTYIKHSTDPLLGKCLQSRYAIFDVLGIGGFGAVYRAIDLDTRLEVAIKTILKVPQNEQVDATARFLQEARVLTQLKSPRIVNVYNVDVVDGVLFMVLELVVGHTLKKLLGAEGPFDMRRTVWITQQILQGLENAHNLGLIHRDLKPDNVLIEVARDDAVKIIDFGCVGIFDTAKGLHNDI